ncbi:MAG: hypothetical protein ACR2RF_18215, partial [Geminicoccaceae bacterium]
KTAGRAATIPWMIRDAQRLARVLRHEHLDHRLNPFFTCSRYRRVFVHATLGVRAWTNGLSGGRIPRIAWTSEPDGDDRIRG